MAHVAKALLFYPMMFLRPFLKLTLRLLGFLMVIGFVGALLFGEGGISLIYLAYGFVLFLVGWFYDTLLLRLNPENTVLVLDR